MSSPPNSAPQEALLAASGALPRTLLITRNLPPLLGGMERLNWHLADQLSHGMNVKIVGPAGSGALKPDTTTVFEAPLKPLWLFLASATITAVKLALRWKPNVVIAGSGLTAPLALITARLCGARSAAYVHGLDITVPNFVYRHLWLPMIRQLDVVIANSRPTAQLAIAAGISERQIRIVHPGVLLPDPSNRQTTARQFRDQYNLGDRKILLSVGRLTHRKGLLEFVTHCLPSITQQHTDTVLVIIGDTPINALHSKGQSMGEIQQAADRAGVGKNVRFLGVVSESELASAMDAASVHVFPVRHVPGDPEGFGMVAIEAAAHGLQTAAFACGGVIDAVKNGTSGRLVAQSDYTALTAAVLDLIDSPAAARESSIAFARSFSWERFGHEIRDALHYVNRP